MTAASSRCWVREANLNDLESLVFVELSAFADGYGDPAPPETVAEVRKIIYGRIELLGRWFRVLEDAQAGPIGMLIACPTNLEPEQMRGLHTSQLEVLRDMYDPRGTHLFIINLAVDRSVPSPGRALDLMNDFGKLASLKGGQRVFFRSRLTGLTVWALEERPHLDLDKLNVSQCRDLAAAYVDKLTSGAADAPIDPVLSMYLALGNRVLGLVDGWERDRLSLGQAVFCEVAPPSLMEGF